MACFREIKRTYFTLLETLIALFILSILLVVIFTFFRDLSSLSVAGKGAQKESFQMRYLETRLAYIFERTHNEKDKKSNRVYFYTQPQNSDFSDSTSLIFTYENEVRKDPTFSGNVLGRLFLDKRGKLRLMTWPITLNETHQHMHQEVLLDNVKSLKFRFYAAPARVTNVGAIASQGPNLNENEGTKNENDAGEVQTNPESDKWHEDVWFLKYQQMPQIVEIVVEVNKPRSTLEKSKNSSPSGGVETYRFRFVLSSSQNYIYYPPV